MSWYLETITNLQRDYIYGDVEVKTQTINNKQLVEVMLQYRHVCRRASNRHYFMSALSLHIPSATTYRRQKNTFDFCPRLLAVKLKTAFNCWTNHQKVESGQILLLATWPSQKKSASRIQLDNLWKPNPEQLLYYSN